MLKLFRYLKPYTLPVLAVLVLIFVQSMSELYLPTLMSDIVDKGIAKGNTDVIYKYGGWMLLVALIGTACSLTAMYLSSKFSTAYGRDMRSRVFRHVEHFTLHEFDTLGTASLITRTTNDITQVQQVLIMITRMMIMAPMMCIGGLILAYHKDPTLSSVLFVALPVMAAVILLISRTGMPYFKAIQVKIDKLNLVLRENLVGIRVVRAFNREDQETERFTGANKDLTDISIKVNKIMAAFMPAMMLIMNFTSIAILWFGSVRIDEGHMQVGDLMAFTQYVFQIMFSLLMMSFMLVMLPRAQASAARINQVLDMNPEIKDPAAPQASGNRKGYVEFRDVTFRYPGAEQPAVSGISFKAEPGEVTAIIGGTGSGKSTLIHLIPRFYDVENGSVLVDGVDVREMTQETLRAKIGFVPQQAVLFTGTAADNIRFGKDDATDEEVRHAAATAQALDFIEEMQDGFGSMISQGGTNLSGGQKQRLSIARALVRRPEIYIFDDSFSALDYKTDSRLRAALKKETADATVLIVAQRVSTVLDADRIIVLEDGEVAGIGTHRELLQTCPVYREIVSSQLSEEEIA
ncbi:ABC transporter ATP-binding protein [Gorillibacterium sp. sgz5001074]|uniref:ABC transporter ATP-binding protein n=1 Tax=Gorillibacterium sp. sgz5001074 TaxID=3446695 RepID=UPI003F661DE2